MKKLLVINFLIKLYARKNIFNIIKEKYGQAQLNLARCIERNRTKARKIKCDIKYLTTCKKNKLLPTFAKTKLSVKVNYRIKMKIARTIIEAELNNKHRKLNFIRRELVHKVNQLRNSIGYISFCTFNKVVNKTINGKVKGFARSDLVALSKHDKAT